MWVGGVTPIVDVQVLIDVLIPYGTIPEDILQPLGDTWEINCSRASTQTLFLVIAHRQEEYPLARKTIGPGPLHLLRYPQRETKPVRIDAQI